MPRAGRSAVACAAALLVAVAIAACGLPSRRDAVASRLEQAGLPRDLPAFLGQLETLELPDEVADLRWLGDGLAGLSIGQLDSETLSELPGTLRSLEVRRSSSLPSLEGLPSGLERLSLLFTSVARPVRLPASLRDLTLGEVAELRSGELPRGLERLTLDDIELGDLRGAPGSLQSLRLHNRGVRSLDGMPDGVRFVSLRHTFVSSLQPLPASLHALELADNPLIDPLANGDLPRQLVELSLENQDLSELVRLPASLRRLRLSGCRGRAGCRAVADFLEASPSTLSHLELEWLRLPGGCWLPRDLQSLTLRWTSDLDPSCLPEGLTELYLEGAAKETVAAIDRRVEKLGIVGPGAAGFGPLATVQDQLRHLAVDHTVSDLGSLGRDAPALTHLLYRGSPLEVLPELPAALQVLDLGDSAGLRSLGPLRKRNTELRVLSIRGTKVDSLADVPASVRDLDIAGSGIVGLEDLPPGLDTLTISRGQLESLDGLPATVRNLAIVD